MAAKKNLSLLQEEEMTEEIRNYPIIYDKSHKGYMERDAVSNAWDEIAQKLSFVENGTQARHFFENFKKRYSKKRNAVKQVNQSGTSSAAVSKARKDLEPYLFFSWYDDFTRIREAKSNVEKGDTFRSEAEFEDSEEEQFNEHTDIDNPHVPSITNNNENTKTSKKNSKKKKQTLPKRKNENDDDEDLLFMKKIADDITKRREDVRNFDSEELYCRSLAEDLRQFSPREKHMIKHEINNILFKYQMTKFQPMQYMQPPSSHSTPSVQQYPPATTNYLQNSASSSFVNMMSDNFS